MAAGWPASGKHLSWSWYREYPDGTVVLTLDDPGQSANTMNAAYRASMAGIIDRLEVEKGSVAGVVIRDIIGQDWRGC